MKICYIPADKNKKTLEFDTKNLSHFTFTLFNSSCLFCACNFYVPDLEELFPYSMRVVGDKIINSHAGIGTFWMSIAAFTAIPVCDVIIQKFNAYEAREIENSKDKKKGTVPPTKLRHIGDREKREKVQQEQWKESDIFKENILDYEKKL